MFVEYLQSFFYIWQWIFVDWSPGQRALKFAKIAFYCWFCRPKPLGHWPLHCPCVVLFENYFSLISLSIILCEKCSYMNSLSLFLCLWESRFHFVEVLLLFYYHFHFVTTAFVGFQWASTALPLRWLND